MPWLDLVVHSLFLGPVHCLIKPYIMKFLDNLKHEAETDPNLNRARELGTKGAQELPKASVNYVVEKFPIIGWLPRYNYKWLLNDFTSGLIIAVMLIPQALSYAKIATIPVQFGLFASWLPGVIYAIMGTSKGSDVRTLLDNFC